MLPTMDFSPTRLICFNKPYGVLSQFTPEGRWRGLKDFIDIPGVYVAGRLDADSEGLLLLTNDGKLQARISDPRHKMEKTYLVQVEGVPDEAALQSLRQGVQLIDGPTRPARASLIGQPEPLWGR
jgi:23S rRNA pseudouridine2457 synthase